MAELQARDLKLIQYLNEAYGKERELETSLQAHIQMTTKAPYKKRLREHLSETKRHAREVERRIKQLGGKAEQMPAPGPDAVAEVAGAAASGISRAVAAAKGPLHAIRGTSEPEKMLKNAKTEYQNEFEEIAQYTAIEVLADALGDKETAQLARSIKREEERMAKFLERQIPQLTRAVIQEEIPASERRRNGGGRRRRSSGGSSSSRRSTSSARKSSSSARKSSSSSRKSSSSSRKSSSTRASSSSRKSGSASSRGRSSGSRSRSSSGSSSRSRSGGSRSGGRRSSR